MGGRVTTLIPYFLANYADATDLSFRDVAGGTSVIKSAEGVRQGDPLGPFFFALAFDEVLSPLVSEYAGQFPLAAYLDDFFFVAPKDRVCEIVGKWKDAMSRTGSNLRAHMRKQECFSPASQLEESFGDADWKRSSGAGTALLGCPIGTEQFERSYWMAEANLACAAIALLRHLRHKQSRMLLLRYCATSRATFMLRASAPVVTKEAAAAYDTAVLAEVASLAGVPVSDLPLLQVQLPLRMGCLGLSSAESIRHAAFLGALNDVTGTLLRFFPSVDVRGEVGEGALSDTLEQMEISYVELQPILSSASSVVEHVPTSPDAVGTLPSGLQQRLTMAIAESRATDLPEDELWRARLLCQSQYGAAVIWHTIPSEPELRLSDVDFTVTLRQWLGLSVISSDAVGLRCGCARHVPLDDNHILSCNLHNVFTFRHDAEVRTAAEMFSAAEFACFVEPSGFVGIDSESGPDLEIPDYNGFQQGVCIDVTVVNPLAPSNVRQAARTALVTATTAEHGKVLKYAGAMAVNRFGILGVAIEATGGFGSGWRQMMATCKARFEASHENAPYTRYGDTWTAASFTDYWAQRFAVVLRRGNAHAVSRLQLSARSDVGRAAVVA